MMTSTNSADDITKGVIGGGDRSGGRLSANTIKYEMKDGRSSVTVGRAGSGFDGSDGVEPVEKRQLTHCHAGNGDAGVDKKARTKLVVASLLCLVFMVGEIVGGVMAHSLAVVSDAAHLLTDFASFMISLMALHLVSRPATKRLSFGWHRAEILGALVSILMLWVITGVLAYSAALRIQSGDYEINATIMLITSGTGVLFNIVLGATLHQHGHSHGGGGGHSHGGHGHSHGGGGGQGHGHTPNVSSTASLVRNEHSNPVDHPSYQAAVSNGGGGVGGGGGYGSIDQERGADTGGGQAKVVSKSSKGSNINVKAAFIHVLGDFLQSIGVLIAAIIIFVKPEWKIADPICTFLFSAFVLVTTVTIMRDVLMVLMEATPRDLNFEEVRDTFLGMEGVTALHDLRLWSLTMNKTALSVHLAVEKGVDPMRVVKAASTLIQQKYNISQTTVQVEEYEEEMDDCTRCNDPKH